MKGKELKVVKSHHLFYLNSVLTVAHRLACDKEIDHDHRMRLMSLLAQACHEIDHMIAGNFGQVAV